MLPMFLPAGPVCEVRHFSESGREVRSSGSVQVPVDSVAGGTLDADLLLVIAGGDPFGFELGRMVAWFRKLALSGHVLGGVSGGPVLLAKAGVMRGTADDCSLGTRADAGRSRARPDSRA